jgi:hypothetical protein
VHGFRVKIFSCTSLGSHQLLVASVKPSDSSLDLVVLMETSDRGD